MTTTILVGDCRVVLEQLPADHFDTIITSPPYWGLRSYLPNDHPDKLLEIGSEPSVDDWVDTMCAVFRQCRRVLKPEGTMWINVGDAYCHGTGADRAPGTKAGIRVPSSWTSSSRGQSQRIRPGSGLKGKDLTGQPWSMALALRSGFARCGECGLEKRGNGWPQWEGSRWCLDCLRAGYRLPTVEQSELGWWLRQEVTWHKNNPMPEQALDRFTQSTESVFLLSKSPRYHWNREAIREPANGGAHPRHAKNSPVAAWKDGPGSHHPRGHNAPSSWDTGAGGHHGKINKHGRGSGDPEPGTGRRKAQAASVTRTDRGKRLTFGNFPDAPPKAAAEGVAPDAYTDGKSYRQGREPGWRKNQPDAPTRNPRNVWQFPTQPYPGAHFATFPPELPTRALRAGCPKGGKALDPFGGAGTTALACKRLGIDCTLIELDGRSADQARGRVDVEPVHVDLFTGEPDACTV